MDFFFNQVVDWNITQKGTLSKVLSCENCEIFQNSTFIAEQFFKSSGNFTSFLKAITISLRILSGSWPSAALS